MPWDMPWFENIKKKSCRYLLQRYLGQFLKEKLTLDRLSVDLYNGTGTVADVSLDVEALNELGEQQNWPLEFLDGYVENMSVSIPLTSLLTDPSYVKVHGLNITVQPKLRDEDATSMFESMWSCMTSSMQLAQECLQQEEGLENLRTPPDGLELFANTIDSILSRVKVQFTDSVIRCEHVPKDSSSGVAMEIRIKNLEYLDEAGNDPPSNEATEMTSQDSKKTYVVSSFTTKKLYFEGVTFSTDEFSAQSRTFSRSLSQSPVNQDVKNSTLGLGSSRDSDNEQFYAASELLSEESQESPKSETSSKKLNDENQECQPIMFAKLTGRQEIRIRLKQSEAIAGPKIDLDVTLGSLITFLTPRQLHTLLELGNGLASPEFEDTSNVTGHQRCVQRPMTNSDYKKVEADLQAQLQPLSQLQGTGLQHMYGWSTASLGGEDSEDDFEPQVTLGGLAEMSDSMLSIASSVESISSTASSQTASSRSSRHLQTQQRRKADSDPFSDIWHLELRVASVAIVLLHEDLLTPSADADDHPLAPSSVRHTAQKAQSFFDQLGLFTVSGYGNKDFEKAAPVFEKACPSNHLRLLAAPVQLECSEQSSTQTVAMIGHCTAARFELLECLISENGDSTNGNGKDSSNAVQRIELLSFTSKKSPQHGLGTKPNLSFTFKQSQRTIRYFQGKKRSTKTKLRYHLDNFFSEFDISIIDRINALLNPHPLCTRSGHDPLSQKTPPYTNPTDNVYLEYKFDSEVVSPECTIKFRFPIPDLRPIHDMQRCPWWKRNVRPDYLTLKFTDPYFSFSSHSRQPANRIELTMSALDAFYTFKDSNTPLTIGRATVAKQGTLDELSKKITLVMQIYPRQSLNGELDESSGADSEPLSIFDGFAPSKIPSPFSSRRVVHESDTPHTRNHETEEDREELVIPGNKQELQEFTDYATKTSRIQVELYLPEVSVQLCSKHMFETLYNRISTDLLLWEPSAPRAYSGGYDGLYTSTDLRESMHPTFSMCKSGIQYESDDSGESDDNGFPYSASENKRSKLRQQFRGNLPGQSTVSISIVIGQGLLHMFTPVRDSAGNVIPGRQGEFLISMKDTSIFSVSGFRGNLDLGYVCVQSTSFNLHHCGLIETPSGCPPLKEVGSIPGKNLLETIYPAEPAIRLPNVDTSGHSRLTVAIRIQANHEIHHMKVIRVACAINDATLRVHISRTEHTWLTQLQDMFDVLDYPIAGYNPSPVLTELHVHVWSSYIDYRPLHLPIRALVTVGSFSISSNLVAQTRTNTLRIITEDCALLLSNQTKLRNLRLSDYVCVMDLGLFELSLRYSDKPRGNNPQMDLRASNNMLHIRTCADSGRALTQLIEYLAMDGDLPQAGGSTLSLNTEPNVATVNKNQPTDTLLPVEPLQQICDLSKSQHERVIEDLSEAMEENLSTTAMDDSEGQVPLGVKMFFFPDEDMPQSKSESSPLPQVAKDLGDTTYVPPPPAPPKRSDTDDEYDIIEKEVEIDHLLKSEKSVIWHVIDQPPRWIKNFDAIPVGKADLLNAPKTFPTPITRYTLCEMNVIWHMYGGNDFPKQSTEKSKEKQKTVNFVSDKKNDFIGHAEFSETTAKFVKSDPDKIKFSTQKKNVANLNWKVQGGAERNHDILMEFQLNKVRFRHEIYPEKAREASRQMLLISELEIRDRLATSQINKFLYQYTTELRPKRAQTNMVIVKQLFVRPDPQLQREESILRVSVLPLRLNIDQDALLFLIAFFSELSGNTTETDKNAFSTNVPAQNTSKHNTPTHQPPIMTVATPPHTEDTSSLEDSMAAEEAQKLISDNLLILLEDDLLTKTEDKIAKTASEVAPVRPPVYFRDVRFDSEVPIRIDYHGKRVDMSGPGGALAGLLMGIGQLNCSEIKLRRFRYRHGILGFEKLVSYALHEWLTDIKKNQLPSLLGGVGPMYALVQLFQGIRDLFWLPIEQYQKDGRIVHGLQRGANSFTTSTAMAAIELTSRIIHLIQATAETAYDMVSPGPSVKRRIHGKKGKRRYNQPQDFREGVANAYILVKEGLEETAHTLVRVASHEHEQKGYSGAVGGILRQIPPTVVKPIILATEATNNVLGGMVCELVPEVRRENLQKWRTEDS